MKFVVVRMRSSFIEIFLRSSMLKICLLWIFVVEEREGGEQGNEGGEG